MEKKTVGRVLLYTYSVLCIWSGPSVATVARVYRAFLFIFLSHSLFLPLSPSLSQRERDRKNRRELTLFRLIWHKNALHTHSHTYARRIYHVIWMRDLGRTP